MTSPTPAMIHAAAVEVARLRAERGRGPVVSRLFDALPYHVREQIKEEVQFAMEAAFQVAPWATMHIEPAQREMVGV